MQIAVNDVAIVNTPLEVYILRIYDYTYTVCDSDSHLQQPTPSVAAYSNVSAGGDVSGWTALLKICFEMGISWVGESVQSWNRGWCRKSAFSCVV